MRDIYRHLYDYCSEQPVINTHSHYLPDAQQRNDLDWLLENAYASWSGIDHRAARGEYLRRLRANSYYHWLEAGLRALSGLDEPLTEANWAAFSDRIATRYPDARAMLQALRSECRYERIVLDAYWKPGDDGGHPELFAPTYRINMYLFGWIEGPTDHNGNSPYPVNGWPMCSDLDEYLQRMDTAIEAAVAAGCSSLKCAAAYDRTLDFDNPDIVAGRRAYGDPNASKADIKAMQDCVFDRACAAAARLGVPMQVHTGLGRARRTNALQLLETIERHPDTTFSLMHGGYPWTDDLLCLTHNCHNVVADICWLPLLSTRRCETFLEDWIDVGDLDRITWGCDTWHCFESYGALLAARQAIAGALTHMIELGRMDVEYAETFIRHILRENARRLYRNIERA